MEQVFASLASFIRQLPIASNDTVADSALSLAFHGSINVSLECSQGINEVPVEDRYRT